jgi:hypothetical protein
LNRAAAMYWPRFVRGVEVGRTIFRAFVMTTIS